MRFPFEKWNTLMPKAIAVVDDDDAVRDSLAAFLTSAGYLVRTFATSDEFLESTRRTKFDCVILDHHMGGMTGVELAEGMARERHHTAIVMISGNLSDAVRSRAKEAGVEAILEKPFSDDELVSAIESLL
ncbi:MAG: response regulator [Azospirillaceae bacterium]